MKRSGALAIWAALFLLLLLSATAMAQESATTGVDDIAAPSAYSLGEPVTAITVTSGLDPDTSKSTQCTGQAVCTLRRAIVESRLLAAGQLPVLIRFEIPATADQGYDSALKIWQLQILPTSDPSVFRPLKGQVIIDGSTQPGGQSIGPKIFLVSPNPQKNGLIAGEGVAGEENQIRGLGFQNFGVHLQLNTDRNVIEDNWFGLAANGAAIYLRNNNPEDGSGSAAIAFGAGADENVVQRNIFAGFDGAAVAIRGQKNEFRENLVGTRADGSVPLPQDASLKCTSDAWLGGGGITVAGGGFVAEDGNRVEHNVFAGIRQNISRFSTQPDAINISGDYHIVQGNRIGVDGTNAEVGVCGRAIYLGGSNTPQYTQVLSNTIVNPELSAVSINGEFAEGNTLSNNVFRKDVAWPQIEGKLEPEAAIQFGPAVPDDLSDFEPAEVTEVNGATVRGTSGENSPCAGCIVEVFLDDTDNVLEALQHVAVATAAADGTWQATLSSVPDETQGLRTTSTTAQLNTIPNTSSGTTTKLSKLYSSTVGFESPASLTITKTVVGAAPSSDWQFMTSNSVGDIARSFVGGSKTFTVTPGTVTVTETVQSGYAVEAACTDGSSVVGRSIATTLTSGVSVGCTFTNTQQTSTVEGTVHDYEGKGIEGATVVLSDEVQAMSTQTSNYKGIATTNTDGSYRFEGVPLGGYTLTVSIPGESEPMHSQKVEVGTEPVTTVEPISVTTERSLYLPAVQR